MGLGKDRPDERDFQRIAGRFVHHPFCTNIVQIPPESATNLPANRLGSIFFRHLIVGSITKVAIPNVIGLYNRREFWMQMKQVSEQGGP